MKKKFVNILGKNLTSLREEAGFDQGQLGDEIGVSRQTINTWEGKETLKLTLENAEKLAKVLNITLDVLTSVKLRGSTAELTQVLIESLRGINMLVRENSQLINDKRAEVARLERISMRQFDQIDQLHLKLGVSKESQ